MTIAHQAAANWLEPLPPFDVYLRAGEQRGVQWTAFRREVLASLWRDAGSLSVYELADVMRRRGYSGYPNSIYRVLSAFSEADLVVSIASTRKVHISPDPEGHDGAALRCEGCDRLQLVPLAEHVNALRKTARSFGYAANHLIIEITGRCGGCRSAHGVDQRRRLRPPADHEDTSPTKGEI